MLTNEWHTAPKSPLNPRNTNHRLPRHKVVTTLGIVRSKKIGCTLETAGSLENFNLSRKLQSNALGSEIVGFLLLLVLMCIFSQ